MTEIDILHQGYLRNDADGVGSTVSLIRDGDAVIVIDPGLVASPAAILGPLLHLRLQPHHVTDVVFSHHHPDHTLNAALFPSARFHDHWAIYQGDRWETRPAEGFELSAHVKLLQTPGHTPQDVTTLAETDEGLVAFTHLWWTAEGPPEDPFATHPDKLHENRQRVLDLGPRLIVPGHGAPFEPNDQTPR